MAHASTSMGEMGEAKRITFFDLQIVLLGKGGEQSQGILSNYHGEYGRVDELYARILSSGLLHVMHTYSKEEGEERKEAILSYSGKFLVEWADEEEERQW